jgi:hypothetical protein
MTLSLFAEPAADVPEERGAVLSPCGTCRYRLSRRWAPGPMACWCLSNPSKADGKLDDPTVRRMRGFSRGWGFGGFVAVNMSAYRATDPAEMYMAARRGVDVVGPENDQHILALAQETGLREGQYLADLPFGSVLCAWGDNARD